MTGNMLLYVDALLRIVNALVEWFYRIATPIVRAVVLGLARLLGRGRYRR
jgi:hypothetical protein